MGDEAKHGTPERPFVEVHLWPIHLARLYMYAGRFMPQEAKKLGCYFGFCDERGVRVAGVKVERDPDRFGFKVESPATHVGWTVAS